MSFNTNSPTKKIILSAEEHLEVKMLSPEQWKAMKGQTTVSRINTLRIEGVTRTFVADSQEVAIEFYNGSAALAHSEEDAAQLKRVTFLRLLYSGRLNEVSYMADVDESVFNRLKESAERFEVGEYLAFFGEAFYRLDSGHVLVKWSSKFKPGKYAILEYIRTMIGINFELSDFLQEEPPGPIESTIQKMRTAEGVDDFSFKIENGQQTNLKEATTKISVALNIDRDSLDFSMDSIDKIETSLFWNADNIDPWGLVTPCAAYLGEILARKYHLEWEIVEGDCDYGRLKSQTGRRIDIVEKLGRSMVDTDYGLAEVKWVVAEITDILSQEKK